MPFADVVILAVIQGLAELLPVSSSAHVVVAEKLLGLNPAAPAMTLLLVMLHTGTMFAVIAYFWRTWRDTYFRNAAALRLFGVQVLLATLLTGIIGGILVAIIERSAGAGGQGGQIEDLFGRLELIAPALAVAGILILAAGTLSRGRAAAGGEPTNAQAAVIGAVQGLCLPFRGFSRSGATISTAMLLGVSRQRAEAFSFALAVVLTPLAIARELSRLLHTQALSGSDVRAALGTSVLGAVIAFVAGLGALRWLSRWLETDRWYLFGLYCLAAALLILGLHLTGY